MFSKKIRNAAIACMLAAGLVIASAEPAEAAIDYVNVPDVAITVDGKTVSSDVSPVIGSGRLMVPARIVSEYLGAQVVWYAEKQQAVIVKGADTLTIYNNSSDYILNGVQKTSDVPITIINGRFMVPLRLVGESLGADVLWSDAARSVTITSQKSETPTNPPEPQPDTPSYTVTEVNKTIQVAQVDGNIVNIRSGPGTEYDKVGHVQSGDVLTATGQAQDSNGETWYRIKTVQDQDTFIAAWLTQDYNSNNNGGNGNNTPPSSTTSSSGDIKVTAKNAETGQSYISFDIGDGTPRVVSNNDNQLVLQVDGVQIADSSWNPVGNMAPFTGFEMKNIDGDTVQITTTVTEHGYFRLDINNNIFSIMAVAKHKDGKLGLAGKTIVVSPGHGIYSTGGAIDYGAVSPINGLTEVDFNTPVSQRLRDKLEAAGATVIMIRSDANPINMTLYQRSVVANSNNADAFIEIHGDSAASSSAYGIGTWAYTDQARLTASAQKDIRNEFAYCMNQAMADTTGQPAYVKYGNFSVIRETEVPCVLIECGFLTNYSDTTRLATPEYQETLAQAMFNGLNNYFSY
jgi:N-acetylmuramoyl-L-alanine amidase